MVNGKVEIPIVRDTLTLAVGGVNLLDRSIKQHVFGDILRRQVTSELRASW